MTRSGPTIVLVHGAWHDERCWTDVAVNLEARHAPWAGLTLPSTDSGAGPGTAAQPVTVSPELSNPALPGFAADVAAVVRLLDSLDTEVTLCGHGYGGMVISETGNHPSVRRLVYLAAFCPWPGERVIDLAPRWWRAVQADGRSMVSARQAIRRMYGDLAPDRAAENAASLRPSSASIFRARSTQPAWLSKPATYVVCSQDHALGVGRARTMARRMVRSQLARGRAGNHVVTIDAGHSPFYSVPALVAEVVLDQR
jgi:pimeloyl-ACP methyl ester carboxylesterase